MIVMFCGHSDVQGYKDVKEWLKNVLSTLILQGADTFYLGGYGAFDNIANNVVRELKNDYPQIKNILILAYLNQSFEESEFHSTLYPELETVPRRYAIVRRNEWMVQEADVVVSYVVYGFGGAAKTYEYAKKKKKKIVNYPEMIEEIGV